LKGIITYVYFLMSEISGRSKSAEEPQRSEKSQADTKDADPFNGMV
jgi:hypothetical protein